VQRVCWVQRSGCQVEPSCSAACSLQLQPSRAMPKRQYDMIREYVARVSACCNQMECSTLSQQRMQIAARTQANCGAIGAAMLAVAVEETDGEERARTIVWM